MATYSWKLWLDNLKCLNDSKETTDADSPSFLTKNQVTHLPLWGTDTKKGVIEIEAGSTILAGIAAANLLVHRLKQTQDSWQDNRAGGTQQWKMCSSSGVYETLHSTPTQLRVFL